MIRDGLVRYHDALAPLMVPIDSVCPHPENDNNGDLDAIEDSIVVNGMYRPIMAQASTGHIVAGNHTWMTLAGKGVQQVPVVMLDIDDDTALRILLGDNAIARKAIRENQATARILERLHATEQGLIGTGYTPDDMEVIKTLAEMPLETNEYGSWPTLTFTVHPKVRAAFRNMTRECDNDAERFELLLRLAGWDGK